METTINPKVHTSCKECVFAEFEDKTQTGCYLDRLSKVKNNIIECYDEEKEFYVINNKVCLFCIKATTEEVDRDVLYRQIRQKIQINYHLILIHKDNEEYLKLTLDSIKEQEIQPTIVTIINMNKDNDRRSIISLLDSYHFKKWRIENTLNDELSEEDYIDIAIDGTKKLPYSFYTVFHTGFKVSNKFSTVLDRLINDDMKSFSIINSNKDGNGLVVPKFIHNLYNGNSHGIYLITKLEADLCDPDSILTYDKLLKGYTKNE